MLCHNSESSPFGRETLDIFKEEGVDFNRVLIGHACGVGDMKYYFDILNRGAWIGFDRFGLEPIAPDKMRLASLIGLLAVGFDRIMLSQDAVGCWLGPHVPGDREDDGGGAEFQLRARLPQHHSADAEGRRIPGKNPHTDGG